MVPVTVKEPVNILETAQFCSIFLPDALYPVGFPFLLLFPLLAGLCV